MLRESNPQEQKFAFEQLQLQNQLITMCEQGDEKAVIALLKRGARPDVSDAKSKQPLGAAVWGMCPGVVNALLAQTGGVASMTWEECEKHNLKYYKEVLIIPKFDPQTFGEWYTLIKKMDPNPFVRAFHLKKVDEKLHHEDSACWENLKKGVERRMKAKADQRVRGLGREWAVCVATEGGFVGYRTQIKQGIENAIRKQSIVNALQSVGFFKEGIDLVCDYALEEERTPALGL
jgi:hypothetical protein